VPEIFNWPQGCAFADRCAYVKDSCKQTLPPIELVSQTANFNESKGNNEGQKTDKPRHLAEHWVRCPEWQQLEASA
jgi:ABC-type dipeptide/oligopeptide/nickel transport system ATPase component